MYCHVCGKHNPDNASSCHACGATFANPYQAPAAPQQAAGTYSGGTPTHLNNYLAPAIFATLCCCLPFGIVSIVYAAQVNAKLAGGDIYGAMQSAQSAKMWFWIAFGFGVVPQVLYLGLILFGAITGLLEGPR